MRHEAKKQRDVELLMRDSLFLTRPTLSLNEIGKITEIENPGFGSDPKGYRLALVTTNGTVIPLSYTYDNDY